MSASVYSHLRNCQAFSRPTTTRGMALWQAIQGLVQHWRSRKQGRRMFASLNGRDLDDLGLSPWDVECETASPFWRD
jgi:uncharacterized protein YjiS (DUF1127 family)